MIKTMKMQEQLIKLCVWLEPKIRPLGWHCAATGSALYGQCLGTQYEREPEDLDVLLYRHNGYNGTLWRPFDVLLHAGFRDIEDCTEYPEFTAANPLAFPTKDNNRRKVFRVGSSGVKVDFLCIDELAP